MFISTVIATIGRTSLTRAVESVLSQDVDPSDLEVIVVNDSGVPLPEAGWRSSTRVTILNTNRRERCVARNAGAAIARGVYLHFLDDDDWLLPGAIRELRAVALASGAALVYGTSRLMDRGDNLLADHNVGHVGNAFVKVMAGEWIPLQSSLIKAENFFSAGAFDPRLIVCQDKDICRRVALKGHVASTPVPVACILRDRENTTTAYAKATAFSVWSRDNILDEPGAFARMRASAQDPYWRGRLIRACLTCVAWNLRKRKLVRALGRGGMAAAAFVMSASDLASPLLWRALLRPHTRKNVY